MTAAPRPPVPDLPVTFRPTRTRVVLLGAGLAMFATITVVAAVLDRLLLWERLSFVVVAAVALAVLALLSRPKVVARESGVTVVNLVRVRRLDWAEIVRVNLRGGDPWVFLDLSDGTSLPVLGIQLGVARKRALDDARALRALVERLGTGTDIS